MGRFKEALEKAKKHRKNDFHRFFLDEEQKTGESEPSPGKTNGVLPGVEVSYSTTKVQKVDHNALLKNRVFSKYRDDGITDHFNLLRLQILQKLEEIGGNSLLITSANPGEGKTFTAINLGICLAQELNRTVLLVDADLRNPTSRHYDFANDFFTIKTDQGLADYLLGQAEITRILLNPGIDKLTILPAGRPLPNSAELLGSLRMATLVDEMKKRYPGDRIIIFDTPSLLCADPVVLSRYVDAVLLVVEQEKTTARDFQRATELLKNSKILGTVLNKSKSGKTAYV
jgi:non-specific protein-tyrosine kinase